MATSSVDIGSECGIVSLNARGVAHDYRVCVRSRSRGRVGKGSGKDGLQDLHFGGGRIEEYPSVGESNAGWTTGSQKDLSRVS